MKLSGAIIKRRGRGARRAAVILALTSVVLILASGTAYASGWAVQDGLEGNPAATWTIEQYGASSGGFDINAGTARSGGNDAWLTSQTEFASVGRPVHLTPAPFHPGIRCAGQVYI